MSMSIWRVLLHCEEVVWVCICVCLCTIIWGGAHYQIAEGCWLYLNVWQERQMSSGPQTVVFPFSVKVLRQSWYHDVSVALVSSDCGGVSLCVTICSHSVNEGEQEKGGDVWGSNQMRGKRKRRELEEHWEIKSDGARSRRWGRGSVGEFSLERKSR